MGSAPRGQSWGLGSATACWQGQGNTISPWEQALRPSLPPSQGVLEAGNVCAQALGTVLPLASHNVPPECKGGLAEAIGGCRGRVGGQKPDLREGREWRPQSPNG